MLNHDAKLDDSANLTQSIQIPATSDSHRCTSGYLARWSSRCSALFDPLWPRVPLRVEAF